MKILITFALLLTVNLVWAHPHVWIDSRLAVSGDKLDIVWEFDEMFSNVLYHDFDVDSDRQFIGMEVKKLKENMFDNLVNFSYFITVYCGNDLLDVGQAEGFSVSSDGKKVTYRFTLDVPFKSCRKEIQIYNYDETYYTDINVVKADGAGVALRDDVGGRKFLEIK